MGETEIKSGNEVEANKTVTFTATPDTGYKVKGWTLDGNAVNGTNNSYQLKIEKAVTVKVSFEALPPGKASYTVKHYQEKIEGGYPAEPAESENQNGTVGANAAYTAKNYTGFTYKSALTKVNNTVQTEGTINADSSTVVELYYERNTVNVTFKLASGNVSGNTADIIKTGKYGTALTAPAPEREGYAFKGWSPAPPSPLAFPAINTEYTAQWKINKYPVTFNVDGAGGTLKATADGVAETEMSPIAVEHGKTVAFIATPATGYRVKGWTLDGTAIAEAGTNTEYTLTVTKPAAVTVSFEPKKALLTLEAGKNTVKVKAKTADGKPITVEGCTVTELANEAETTLTAKVAGTQIALIGELTELNCRGSEDTSNRSLVALDVSGCTALQKLDCAKNQLTALDVQGLKDLQELNCRSNQIPELDVHGLTALQKLECQGNKITALNVQGLTALKELDCQSNKELTALHVHGCTALQKLNCRFNKLTALDVSGLTALQELDCQSNQLKTLNVQGLTALQKLYCDDNQLADLDVSGLTALQELICHTNQLTTLNVQGLTKLQQLYCSNNQLTALNVQSCTALKKLECYKNKLNADAFTKLFNDLPAREVSDKAKALLYADRAGVTEENCKDFSTPESLKKAFENARDVKHWKMQKANHFGFGEDI
ncbi:leucine-rich repeat domain-containing protein [Treponema medium]|uniref:leucine-rich repeat domain-containing protein n=1 Tax=Treponema medium TaxID=58231 RepID=UPI00338F02EF